MHMADALLAPAVAATMYVASGTATGISSPSRRGEMPPANTTTSTPSSVRSTSAGSRDTGSTRSQARS